MNDKEKVDYSDTPVNDKLERWYEIILATAGLSFSIYGGLSGVIDGNWAIIGMTISFALYQSTSVVKYINKLK